MPLYLDRHHTEGVSEQDIVEAHELDLNLEEQYDARFLTYWYDEGRQTTFCLVSAPSAETISEIHAATHGQIPNDVSEVDQTEVLSFLGRIADIPTSTKPEGAPVDKATRTIMFTDLVGYTSMMSRLGDDRAFKLLREHNTVVRDALTKFGGREIKHTGDGVMASFDVADQAVKAAVQMGKGIAAMLSLPKQLASSVLLVASAGASSVTDNIPLAAMLAKILAGMETPGESPYWWCVIFGANLGGNITPIGSASTVVAMTFIHREKLPLSFVGFVVAAAPFAAIQLVLAVVYVLIVV